MLTIIRHKVPSQAHVFLPILTDFFKLIVQPYCTNSFSNFPSSKKLKGTICGISFDCDLKKLCFCVYFSCSQR